MKFVNRLASTKATVCAAFTLACTLLSAAPSYAATLIPVDLELWLGVDVSGSINVNEFSIQKTGYVNAFNSPELQNLIASSTNGVAVGYGYWSTQQNVAVNWTLLKTAQDVNNFATAIAATLRPTNLGSGTGIGAAIDFGVNQILTNTFEGTKKTIDISGDGTSNVGQSPALARDAAAAKGITINGLPIGNQGLVTFYNNNVRTTNGFVISTPNLSGFEAAIKQKLSREITEGIQPSQPIASTPEPVSGLALGLVGLGLVTVRKWGNEE